MNRLEEAEVKILRAAAELYNDAEILREALESNADDDFTESYIAAERGVTAEAAGRLKDAVDALCEAMGC